MMTLYLCEKPSQARDIARHLHATTHHGTYLSNLNEQVMVTWCLGHLLKMAAPQTYRPDISPWRLAALPVIPKHWQMVATPATQKQLTAIAGLLKRSDTVVIATDADREGEVIAREVLTACHYTGKLQRLWLSALDDASIQRALQCLQAGETTEALYFAGLARQRADWLIGLNMTMAVSSLYGVNSVLSIGRVQTPTLALLVEREKAIEQFVPEDYFVLRATFMTASAQAIATRWQPPQHMTASSGHCGDRAAVQTVVAKITGESGVISDVRTDNVAQPPPLGFSLSALQKEAAQRYGFGAKQTLTLAQALYEKHKAITYPRTDCTYLPVSQHDEAKVILPLLAKLEPRFAEIVAACDPQARSRIWNDKKITAHHAMIPTTNDTVVVTQMDEAARKLYHLICRYYMAQFLGDYHEARHTVIITCAGETFKAVNALPQALGWKHALREVESPFAKDVITAREQLLALPVNTGVQVGETQMEKKQTQPPSRFTEGTLIEAMKTVASTLDDPQLKAVLKNSQGIGTEATRANIIEVLYTRGYIIKQNHQRLQPTAKGRALMAIVPASVKDPVTTAVWEHDLARIAEGKYTLDAFMTNQITVLKTMLDTLRCESATQNKAALQLQSDTISNKAYLCPDCEKPLRRIKNKNGKHFWGCIGYPTCRFLVGDRRGKPMI